MTPGSQRTSPHRALFPTLWLISGRSVFLYYFSLSSSQNALFVLMGEFDVCVHYVLATDGVGERLHSDSNDDSSRGGWREAV